MESLPLIKKQILILFVFAVLSSVAMIIHGIFFDLAWSEIARLTLEGLVLTVLIVFPGILFLEWVFDMNNEKKLEGLENRVRKIEKKKGYK